MIRFRREPSKGTELLRKSTLSSLGTVSRDEVKTLPTSEVFLRKSKRGLSLTQRGMLLRSTAAGMCAMTLGGLMSTIEM